jgi:hypothetical protein
MSEKTPICGGFQVGGKVEELEAQKQIKWHHMKMRDDGGSRGRKNRRSWPGGKLKRAGHILEPQHPTIFTLGSIMQN